MGVSLRVRGRELELDGGREIERQTFRLQIHLISVRIEKHILCFSKNISPEREYCTPGKPRKSHLISFQVSDLVLQLADDLVVSLFGLFVPLDGLAGCTRV
jgi:hypothetical protein